MDKEGNNDKEIFAEDEAQRKALKMVFFKSEMSQCLDNKNKSLLDLITEREKDKPPSDTRDNIIYHYEDACQRFEMEESGSREASFWEGMRNGLSHLLWLNYGIDYKYYIPGKPNIQTYKLKEEVK
ncbi:hypothetical protein ES708_31179 [subsurface metagenome]